MKLSVQVLRSRAKVPPHSVQFIDLSRCNIGNFDKISVCTKLQSLNLSHNDIDFISSLDACLQLWKIDLSNNKVCNLEGLCRFVALGTLILCNNDLSWAELSKIRHMHILNLSLHGNPQLEKDPYYRIHAIDCLPNVWMLDGRIVTSSERLQVECFFEESALTDKPVRHKLPKEHFIPSFRKKLEVNGVFGYRTDHLMRRFPINGALNIETDHRRIIYLAYNLQQDLLIEAKYINRNWNAMKNNPNCIEEILEIREDDRVRCNMLLLLLVASLEFAIPSHLMQEVLRCTKLYNLSNMDSMELFLLPKEVRCHIVSLLLSSVKVDKDAGEEGGLYDKLYLCLYQSVSELTRLAQGGLRPTPNKYTVASERTSKCLIASEVVQLLCIVPAFFDYITKDTGVMNLLTMATSDIQFVDRIDKLMKKMEQNQWDLKRIYENVAEVTLRAIQENTASLISKKSKRDGKENYVLNTRKASAKRPKSSPIFASHFHMTGRPAPDKKPVRIKSGKPYRGSYIPQAQLGEKVLLGPQNVARVISVPEPELVLVQMDIVPDESGAMISNRKVPEEHYKYLDMKNLYWDYLGGYWRPKGTVGDRITMQSKDQMEEELITHAQKLATKDSPSDTNKDELESRKVEVVEEPPKEHKVDIPRAVSARYKERHRLRLELEEELCVYDGADKADRENPIAPPPPPSRAKSARPISQTTDHSITKAILSEPEDGDEDELLYAEGQSQLSRKSPASSLVSLEEPELKGMIDSKPNTRPGTGIKRATPDQKLINDKEKNVSKPASPDYPIEIPQVDIESQGTTARSSSDISSPKKLIHNSSSRPDVIQENRSLQGSGDSNEAHTRMEEEDSDRLELGSMDDMYTKSIDAITDSKENRPISAKSSDKIIDISLNEAEYDSETNQTFSSRIVTPKTIPVPELQQTRTYQRSSNSANMTHLGNGYEQFSRGNRNQRIDNPPAQRPASPYLQHNNKRSQISVQHGAIWLGGGKDIHWEKRLSRPKSGHVPGWKEGLAPRPKSAAAVRAHKRNKTPNIVTPSSMAFEDVYGRHMNKSTSDLTYYKGYTDHLGHSQVGQQHQQMTAPRRYNSKEDGINELGYNEEIYDISSTCSQLTSALPSAMSVLASHNYPHNVAVWQQLHGPMSDVLVTGQKIKYRANILSPQQMQEHYEMISF